MSTYINSIHPDQHAPYLDIPDDVVDYLHYLELVKLCSPRTINAYYIDLRTFFRYMAVRWSLVSETADPDHIDLTGITTEQIGSITKRDIFDFLDHVRGESSNGAKARARKLCAIRGLFRYMTSQSGKLQNDPAKDISLGSPKKSLPKYLTLDESTDLLNNIQSDFYERDFCIITLFLNCGMRLTELASINISSFRDDTIRILGKGNKERLVYLNDACQDAIAHYQKARTALPNLIDKQAFFVSKKTGKRLSTRRIEQIVERCMRTAGLDGRGYSPHKLRHTAATLMYQNGVDMLALKEILGHESVSTTQIYTHINNEQLKKAAAASPLAHRSYQPPQPSAQTDDTAEPDHPAAESSDKD